MATVRPNALPAAGSVNPNAAIITDDGSLVQKATPIQVVDAAIPLASQAEAEAGANNANRMTPLRVKQAIDAQTPSLANLASSDSGKGASLVGTEGTGTVEDVINGLNNVRRLDLREFREGVGQGNEGIDTDTLQTAVIEAATQVVPAVDRDSGTTLSEIMLPTRLNIGASPDFSLISINSFRFGIRGVAGGTRITIADDAVLFDVPAGKLVTRFQAEDVDFVGGAAALIEREPGSTVSVRTGGGGIFFNRCGFYNQTKLAIGSESSNSPLWRITNFELICGDDAVGMVLPSGSGHIVADGFMAGFRLGIVMRDFGQGCFVRGIRFGGQNGTDRADIVLEPEQQGNFRPVFINTYAGVEGDDTEDAEIFIADLDMTSGVENVTLKTTLSTGYGRAILDSSWVGSSYKTRAPIYSRCENIVLSGAVDIVENYPNIIEFDTAVIPEISLTNKWCQVSDLKVTNADEVNKANRPNTRMSNLPGFGFLSGGMFAGEPGNIGSGSSPAGNEVALITADITAMTATGTTTLAAATTDREGGTQAREITFTSTDSHARQNLVLTSAVAGAMSWLEFDVKQSGGAQAIDQIQVFIGTGQTAYFRSVPVYVGTEWRTIRIPFMLPSTGTALRVGIVANAAQFSGSAYTLTDGGSGYTEAPTVSFTGGGGSGAAATASVFEGEVVRLNITNAGSGYTTAPTIGFTGGGGSGAAATATITAGGTLDVDCKVLIGRVYAYHSSTPIDRKTIAGAKTVATLPSAVLMGPGSRAFVTDANATTVGSTAAGGGTNKAAVVSDGAAWKIVSAWA